MMLPLNLFAISLLASCLVEFCLAKENNFAKSKILSRKKRYVTFPEGSSFSLSLKELTPLYPEPWKRYRNRNLEKAPDTCPQFGVSGEKIQCAGCMTVGVIGQPAPATSPGTFTFGLNWGIAYELPNATETLRFYHKKYKKPVAQRRSRRELYEKLELVLDNMGYNGRQCILKTLCESTQRLVPHGENMVEEMFRTLFTLPMSKVLQSEPLEHTIYDSAHRLGRLLESCDVYKCPMSLVDLAQGYYNAPAPKMDTSIRPWSLFSSNFG